ncbi:MAG TPA: hypothetical protein VES39_10840, partial [Rhodospirillales bacterium]|nr:hypothetical protein [Rhodospirillales bacterium]
MASILGSILLALPMSAWATSQGKAEVPLRLAIAGPVETAFRWSTDACSRDDFPDAPARALRTADGEVRLFASHHINRVSAGPSLDRLRHDCRVVYRGAGSDRPQSFDDMAWLISPYTLDGRTIYALVHNEFHGHLRPSLCRSRDYRACWYNALTWAVSTDRGRSFSRADGAAALVAAPPYQYEPDSGPYGLFNPSNIVARDGFYYAFAFARPYRHQAGGACLLRTDRLDDPASWRAWDGGAFTVRFGDPYAANDAARSTETCVPVAPRRLTASIGSLVRHLPTGLFIATFAGTRG